MYVDTGATDADELFRHYDATPEAIEASAGRVGPSDAVIQDLYASGGRPSYVVAAFPGLPLQATTLPPDLADSPMVDASMKQTVDFSSRSR